MQTLITSSPASHGLAQGVEQRLRGALVDATPAGDRDQVGFGQALQAKPSVDVEA